MQLWVLKTLNSKKKKYRVHPFYMYTERQKFFSLKDSV